ncbi:helix-turn-helix domain-containing protein [Paracoccus litorisediminis]|uniref:Helix-turn-helix domain-containing protein n=1 Tax=Paracoccus litorisediminis TaxID=2006130 RepID=A0A844HUL0_9RHOB|nr:helix-turn-helix domain-containing protein [Paracoccus litorisediminis]MTH61192.1 helix-turn-helix domain-containing protein [Paracoccus litorisediminis]
MTEQSYGTAPAEQEDLPVEAEEELEDEDDEDVPASSGASRSARELTDAEFVQARELYELGKMGVRELADQFGCSRQTLHRRFKKVGAKRGSRAHEVSKATQETVERFAQRRAERIEETRLSGYTTLKQARLLAQKVVIDAVKANRPIESTDDALKAVQRYNKILLDNIAGTLSVLDAANYVDEEDLPILQIEDLTADDILKHHISTGVLPDDATIEDLNTEIFGDD